MSVSLHTAAIGAYLQVLPSVAGMIDKAEAHCAAHGLDPQELTTARLADDMWPFAKQVFECGHHSARAIEGVRAGVFGPELHEVPADFAALRAEVAGAIAFLQAVPTDELDAIAGRDMRFEFKTMRMDFTVADFLLTFSLPNFYFHATTAYAILRGRGVKLGKMDYLGRPRLKG